MEDMIEEEDSEESIQRTENTPNTVAPRTRKYFPETWIWNCIETRFVIVSNLACFVNNM